MVLELNLQSFLFYSTPFFSLSKKQHWMPRLFVSVNLAVNLTDSVIMQNYKGIFLVFGWGGLEEEVHFYPS